jgi:hypothetical protein
MYDAVERVGTERYAAMMITSGPARVTTSGIPAILALIPYGSGIEAGRDSDEELITGDSVADHIAIRNTLVARFDAIFTAHEQGQRSRRRPRGVPSTAWTAIPGNLDSKKTVIPPGRRSPHDCGVAEHQFAATASS